MTELRNKMKDARYRDARRRFQLCDVTANKTTLKRMGDGARHSRARESTNRRFVGGVDAPRVPRTRARIKNRKHDVRPCIDPLCTLARTPSSISWRSRWLMLPNKLSRKTCRSRGISRACTAPFISTPGVTLISLERGGSAPLRHATPSYHTVSISNAPNQASSCIHGRCVYMPVYIHYADDIQVIRFTSTSLSTSLRPRPRFGLIIHRPAFPAPSSGLTRD